MEFGGGMARFLSRFGIAFLIANGNIKLQLLIAIANLNSGDHQTKPLPIIPAMRYGVIPDSFTLTFFG
jgi:hypothetical protein